MCHFLTFHWLKQVTWPGLTSIWQEYLNFHQGGAVNILNNNGIYLHVSHFVSLLWGITLELLVAKSPVT